MLNARKKERKKGRQKDTEEGEREKEGILSQELYVDR